MRAPIRPAADRAAQLAERRCSISASDLWRAGNLAGVLDRAAAVHPDRVCVIADDRPYQYLQLARWCDEVAQGLLRLGACPGDRIAVLLPNSAEFVILQYAIARIGCTSVPINCRLKPPELHYILTQSRSNILVTASEIRGISVAAALSELSPAWETSGGGETAPDLRRIVVLDAEALRAGPELSLQALRADDHCLELPTLSAVCDPHATAAIFYTSGTTGLPKGVMLSHDALLRSAYSSALTRGFQDGRVIVSALPLYHAFAYVEGMLASVFAGGTIVPEGRFDAAQMLAAIDANAASDALVVPTMLIDLVGAAASSEYDLGTLTDLMCAGSPAPESLWQHAVDVLGVSYVVQGYGMTETSASATMTRPEDPLDITANTVGQPKYGNAAGLKRLNGALSEYRVVDPETGQPLPAGEEGELAGRGPAMTTGYFEKASETAATITADAWVRSGDMGRILADGRIQITGRAKELYRCGGESVSPREVENTLARYPGVGQVYVVGIPDKRLGEVGAAWVVPTAGSAVDEQEAIAYCRQALAGFKVPRHVLSIGADSLPLTPTGKVQKFQLARWASEQINQHSAESGTEDA
jgi:fatty-acyl-CoA synthase